MRLRSQEKNGSSFTTTDGEGVGIKGKEIVKSESNNVHDHHKPEKEEEVARGRALGLRTLRGGLRIKMPLSLFTTSLETTTSKNNYSKKVGTTTLQQRIPNTETNETIIDDSHVTKHNDTQIVAPTNESNNFEATNEEEIQEPAASRTRDGDAASSTEKKRLNNQQRHCTITGVIQKKNKDGSQNVETTSEPCDNKHHPKKQKTLDEGKEESVAPTALKPMKSSEEYKISKGNELVASASSKLLPEIIDVDAALEVRDAPHRSGNNIAEMNHNAKKQNGDSAISKSLPSTTTEVTTLKRPTTVLQGLEKIGDHHHIATSNKQTTTASQVKTTMQNPSSGAATPSTFVPSIGPPLYGRQAWNNQYGIPYYQYPYHPSTGHASGYAAYAAGHVMGQVGVQVALQAAGAANLNRPTHYPPYYAGPYTSSTKPTPTPQATLSDNSKNGRASTADATSIPNNPSGYQQHLAFAQHYFMAQRAPQPQIMLTNGCAGYIPTQHHQYYRPVPHNYIGAPSVAASQFHGENPSISVNNYTTSTPARSTEQAAADISLTKSSTKNSNDSNDSKKNSNSQTSNTAEDKKNKLCSSAISSKTVNTDKEHVNPTKKVKVSNDKQYIVPLPSTSTISSSSSSGSSIKLVSSSSENKENMSTSSSSSIDALAGDGRKNTSNRKSKDKEPTIVSALSSASSSSSSSSSTKHGSSFSASTKSEDEKPDIAKSSSSLSDNDKNVTDDKKSSTTPTSTTKKKYSTDEIEIIDYATAKHPKARPLLHVSTYDDAPPNNNNNASNASTRNPSSSVSSPTLLSQPGPVTAPSSTKPPSMMNFGGITDKEVNALWQCLLDDVGFQHYKLLPHQFVAMRCVAGVNEQYAHKTLFRQAASIRSITRLNAASTKSASKIKGTAVGQTNKAKDGEEDDEFDLIQKSRNLKASKLLKMALGDDDDDDDSTSNSDDEEYNTSESEDDDFNEDGNGSFHFSPNAANPRMRLPTKRKCPRDKAKRHEILLNMKFIQPRGFLLADEMGLGKTVQGIAGAFFRQRVMKLHQKHKNHTIKKRAQKIKRLPSIIVGPNDAVLKQWEESLRLAGVKSEKIIWYKPNLTLQLEGDYYVLLSRYSLMSEVRKIFEKKRSNLFSHTFNAEGGERYYATLVKALRNQYRNSQGKDKNKFKHKKESDNAECCTRLLKQFIFDSGEGHKQDATVVRFRTLLIDEAHFMKNMVSFWGIGAALLGAMTERVVPLSGTPYNNGPQDVATLMTFVDPTLPSSFKSWWMNATKEGAAARVVDAVKDWRTTYMLRRDKSVLSSEHFQVVKNVSTLHVKAPPSELGVYMYYESIFLMMLEKFLSISQESANIIVQKKRKEMFKQMMAVMTLMRMSLIHPLVPQAREYTIQFSPSRKHLLKRETRLNQSTCVFCASKHVSQCMKEAELAKQEQEAAAAAAMKAALKSGEASADATAATAASQLLEHIAATVAGMENWQNTVTSTDDLLEDADGELDMDARTAARTAGASTTAAFSNARRKSKSNNQSLPRHEKAIQRVARKYEVKKAKDTARAQKFKAKKESESDSDSDWGFDDEAEEYDDYLNDDDLDAMDLIPLPSDICTTANHDCPHYIHEDCLQLLKEQSEECNQSAKCPRCADVEYRARFRSGENIEDGDKDEKESNSPAETGSNSKEKFMQCCRNISTTFGSGGFQPSAKMQLVAKWIKDVPRDEKMIIYSFFKAGLDLVEGMITEDLHIECARFDGDLPPEHRHEDLLRFKNKSKCRVLLASIQSGGTGLNITEANHALFLDRWFNPCVHEQAEDRCYRIGQIKPTVEIAYCDNVMTVDEVMCAINTLKANNATILLADGSSMGAHQNALSYSDLSGRIGDMMRSIRLQRTNHCLTRGADAPLEPVDRVQLLEAKSNNESRSTSTSSTTASEGGGSAIKNETNTAIGTGTSTTPRDAVPVAAVTTTTTPKETAEFIRKAQMASAKLHLAIAAPSSLSKKKNKLPSTASTMEAMASPLAAVNAEHHGVSSSGSSTSNKQTNPVQIMAAAAAGTSKKETKSNTPNDSSDDDDDDFDFFQPSVFATK